MLTTTGKPRGYSPRNMISVYLQGGLGNAMFQIAAIESLGKKYNQEVYYSNTDRWVAYNIGEYAKGRQAIEYMKLFPNINLYKNHNYGFTIRNRIKTPFRYTPLSAHHGDLFVGYFQSEQFFYSKSFVKDLFSPSDDMNNQLLKYGDLLQKTTCSLHVRRGNYMPEQHIHPLLTMDYYAKAVSKMKPLGVESFLVFSDDLSWCKNNFHGAEFIFIEDTDFVQLFLMGKCTHNIIANSTFSWWGAWLGETDNTIVIAPHKWFGRSMPLNYEQDIMPQRWVKL